MNKKLFVLGIILGVLIINIMSAVGEVSYCCERTESGAWCQNAPEGECDDSYRKVPTSCEATSYCKLGTCIDSQEGTCMENTPQKICEDNKGLWAEEDSDDLPQCSLGCCLIGDQAAFVTQTRCKRLSSLYGLETNFQTNIGNEIQCIASAVSDVKGACVFEKEFEKTCLFLTKKECQEMNAEFHEGYLCSAETLGTNCGPSKKTSCVEGEDEVYFLDTCGNLANIYDSDKIDDKNYWTKVYSKIVSCNYGLSNSNSKICGNCEYYLVSTFKFAKRGEDKIPNYGDYICRDLSCYKGNKKIAEHGETWCAGSKEYVESKGVSEIKMNNGIITSIGKDLPGGRYFRLTCYNGEITVEPCADFRQEVCVEDEVNGFSVASCRVNKWQDCYSQENQQDCKNRDKRDCQWIFSGIKNYSEEEEEYENIFACVPLYSPGFDFWNPEGDAESLCSIASTECIVTYVQTLLEGEREDEDCIEEGGNCHCLDDEWEEYMNTFSISLGDCGNKKNYIGSLGYQKEGIFETEEYESEEDEE